jgi:hypothetical protein
VTSTPTSSRCRQFPRSVRQRFAHQHPQLADDDLTLVEAAARQWFRLAARHPVAKLSMASVLVDDFWRELLRHTRDYATFCDAAFGRFLPHDADSAVSAANATANRTTRLRHTLNLARQDEGCGPRGIPLLFRVDRQLGLDGAGYVADCGGHGECYEVSGTVCLQHLIGLGKQTNPGLPRPGTGPPDPYQWPNQGMGPS